MTRDEARALQREYRKRWARDEIEARKQVARDAVLAESEPPPKMPRTNRAKRLALAQTMMLLASLPGGGR